MLSEEALNAGPRAILARFSFPDKFEIWRIPDPPVLDDWQRPSEVRAKVETGDLYGRLRPSTLLAQENQRGGQLQEQIRWDFFVPVGTDINAKDQVKIVSGRFAGQMYEVEAVLGPRTYELATRCSLKSIR